MVSKAGNGATVNGVGGCWQHEDTQKDDGPVPSPTQLVGGGRCVRDRRIGGAIAANTNVRLLLGRDVTTAVGVWTTTAQCAPSVLTW